MEEKNILENLQSEVSIMSEISHSNGISYSFKI